MTRNYYFLFVALLSFIFFGISCNDDSTSSETCSDGILNQDETGIDCGGVCEPCQTTSTYSYMSAKIDGAQYSNLLPVIYPFDGISTLIHETPNIDYLWLQGDNSDYQINIRISDDNWGSTGTFPITNGSFPDETGVYGSLVQGSGNPNTDYIAITSGSLTITKFDLVNKEFEGTFDMVYYREDDNGTPIGSFNITNGTLDYPLDNEAFQ